MATEGVKGLTFCSVPRCAALHSLDYGKPIILLSSLIRQSEVVGWHNSPVVSDHTNINTEAHLHLLAELQLAAR